MGNTIIPYIVFNILIISTFLGENCPIHMKRLLIPLLPLVLLLSPFLSQAGEITLNFVKNKEGEVILMVAGHTDSVIVKLNDQTFTLYKEDDRLNLSGIGIESFVTDVNTESGEAKNRNVPPVASLTLPYQATPL